MSTASTMLVGPRANRRGLVITNTGPEVVWLTLGPVAVVDEGIYLVAAGGSYSQGPEDYTGIISGITLGGPFVVTVAEQYYEN